jgi:uncharacterized iron-regulated protein
LPRLAALALALALASCGGAVRPPDGAREAPPPTHASGEVTAFDGQSGVALSFEALVTRAAAADVVLLGEVHGHPRGLPWAARLWAGVAERAPRAGLGLEFLERDTQPVLEHYLAGRLDEPSFVSSARRDGELPEAHRAMLREAKRLGRRVVAANAPRPYVKMARAQGFDVLRALPEAERALFRVPDDPPTGRYRDAFFALMSGSHAGSHAPSQAAPSATAEALFRAQSLWDATMADSVARAAAGGSRPFVLVVGSFHVDFDGGVPQLLARYAPSLTVLEVSVVASEARALEPDDRGRADVVAYAGER